MEVTISTILNKMDRELQKAYEAKDNHALREHLIVIKTLCGLVLEERMTSEEHIRSKQTPIHKIESVTNKKEDNDVDSNSDSLFDF
ncbi:YwdI family protein [Bacillus suaedaesalsae]|uniref:YwdI family protein n=1 Tax=Bacillus suaedaesalsae TaxID=2810349 RepID=A0ABS2DEC7_9BACI|nr:YwdI family protein [Bacillus suaedaesalsae]MBM6616819.1 YwdI family protein [Bacillus suaedaesalsae]